MHLRHAAAIAASLLATIIVIDGDTVEVSGFRYRLLDFDAPEIGHAKCEKERQRGVEAEQFLRSLIQTQKAELLPRGLSEDKYGRGLAYLRIDGENVAHIMVRAGLAKWYNGRGPRPDWCR